MATKPKQAKQTLYLIDGHAHAYQQYFAVAGLTSPDGKPTGAVFGVTRLLKKLLEEKQPDYVALVWDPKGKTFRHDLFPDYKKDRAPMPPPLKPQIGMITELAELMGVKVITVPRYEADDVIGTLAVQAAEQGIDAVIVGKDKDYAQLISDRIQLYDPAKDTLLGADWLMEKKGLKPEQVRDWLALAGDTADGFAGIPGVGDKTAKKILDEWGDIANAMAHAEQVKPKKASLYMQEHPDELQLCVELATIALDAPVTESVQDLALAAGDPAALGEEYRKLGFRSLASETAVEVDRSTYRIVASMAELKKLVTAWKKCDEIALDTETTSASPVLAELVGISICAADGEAYYIPVQHPEADRCLPAESVVAEMNRLLAGPKAPGVIGHNLKYDLTVMYNAGVPEMRAAFDTMVAAYLCTPGGRRLSLDDLAADHLGVKMIPREEVMGKGKNLTPMNEVSVDIVGPYAAEDADMTWRLAALMREALDQSGLREINDTLELPLVPILAEMERTGIACDAATLSALAEELRGDIQELDKKLEEEAGEPVNPRSPKKLAVILFDKLGLPVIKKGKSGPSTDASVLEELAHQHPLPELLLEHRKLSKLLSTYLEKLPELINPATKRIHTDFGQTVAATGRLSSRDPNLQNIPVRTEIGRKIRGAFTISQKGRVFVAADYSQVELRMLAHFCGDPKLIRTFETNGDIHTQVASDLSGLEPADVDKHWRNIAKTVNFGIIYGQTAYGLSRQLKIAPGEAQSYIDDFFDKYAKVKEWVDGVIAEARERREVRTILGRRRALPDIDAQNRDRRQAAERTAVNTVVQGSAADLMKRAMLDVRAALAEWAETHDAVAEPDCPAILLQIHDELLFEFPKKQAKELTAIVTERMEQAMELKVPLLVTSDQGTNWGEL
ncbi:MAG: DNA polymerase I [Planctomycetota bacterium]|jgi:DNA polymerase-1